MTPDSRTEYIVLALQEGASMYPEDAKAFLAEHDAHRRTETLAEAATLLETLDMDDAAAQLRYQATPYTDDTAPTVTTGSGGQG